MSNEELVLVALAGLPLDIAHLKHATGLPAYHLCLALARLEERGLVARLPRSSWPERPPVRFRRR